jgi:hypothetical protein
MKGEIDYNSKILNFLAMTDTSDQELAVKYLEKSNWDETEAVNKFLNNFNENSNNNNDLINNNTIQNDIFNDINRSNNELITNIELNNNTNNNNQSNENFLYKYFIKLPYQFLLNCCSENREVSKSEERKIFQILPNLMDDFLEFCHLIKRKIGIIVFYSEENLNFLKNIIGQLSRSTNCINLLKENFMIYPILANSRDGNKIQDLIIDDNNNELLLPSFIFCFNRQNNRNSYLNPILNKNHIIYTLEGESTEINSFYLALKDLSDKYLNKNKNDINSINSLDKSFGLLTDGEILSQQKFEMEELERKAQIKEEQIKQEKNTEKLIEKEIETKAKAALSKIVEEPDINNPDVTTICFRYPDGDRTKTRRFLKNNKIQNLYDYVTSLGEEIYTEKENKNFSLNQPFPPKKYENMDNTLEQENLFPNAVIQIREE